MEKNQIVGFILIFALLLGYTYMSKPSEEELMQQKLEQEAQLRQDSLDQIKTLEVEQPKAVQATPDSIQLAQNASAFGIFAPATVGNNEMLTLENDDIRLNISSKGGKIINAVLKKHKRTIITKDRQDSTGIVKMMNHPSNKFGYSFPANVPAGAISTEQLYFTPTLNGNNLTLVANLANGASIQQVYTLGENYQVDYAISTKGLENLLPTGKSVTLNWVNHLDKLEKNASFEASYSTAYFKESENSPDYCSCRTSDTENTDGKPVDWISNTNQFFNTSLMTNGKPFQSAKLETEMVDDVKASSYLKKITNEIQINPSDLASGLAVTMYIGPNEFNDLKAYGVGLEEIIPYGNSIFGTINRWVIRPFFDFLSSFISSKGLTIILLIFLIKMALYPLMYKMLKSQALMGALKPKIAPLKEKYKDEPQKLQMETMKLYREYGVSPFGGCFPMFLQMPIWYALFRFFPASIIFRQEPFMWVNDLSSYDSFFELGFELPFIGSHISLFAILWALTTVVYTYYNTKNMDIANSNPAMKYMQYLMPIMFFGFFNNYAAALVCYMFFSNLINVLQTVITKQFVFSDTKLLAELDKKKAKPKKKSNFQARLEEAMKQQQMQQQKKQNKK